MSLFFFGNNFYKTKETFKFFLQRYWKFVEFFWWNQSRINNVLLYFFSNQYYVRSMHRAAVWQHSSNSNIKIVHNSIEHFLWNPSDFFSDEVLSCLWIVFANSVFQVCSVREMRHHFISRTEHLNIWGITSNGTDSFHIKPITPGHPIAKISTRLTIFWGGTWKTEFVKTIHRRERASSEEKSYGFHKKCSIELWTILMFELLLCCHAAAQCMERT